MYKLAIMPTQSPDKVTILAPTEEWARFVDHLKATRQGVVASWITLDVTQPMNKITFDREQGNIILGMAGIAY